MRSNRPSMMMRRTPADVHILLDLAVSAEATLELQGAACDVGVAVVRHGCGLWRQRD